LANTFEELGITTLKNTAVLNDFIAAGIAASGAIQKINFDTLAADINDMYNLLNKIEENGRVYNEDDYKSLIASNKNLAKSFT
jgi:hypothetical protein